MHFDKPAPGTSSPIGKNQYLRSIVGCQFESYTCAKSAVETTAYTNAVGVVEQTKVLQPGEILAKITSGPETGKVGPFQAGVTDGRQTVANIVGVNDSYSPYEINVHDVNVSALYHGTAVLGWCTTRNADGDRITLTTTIADELRGKRGLDVTFK